MVLFFVLCPLASCDLDAQVLPIITASDAFPSFGFGVSVRPADPHVLDAMEAASTSLDAYLELEHCGDEGNKAKGRVLQGTPVMLPYDIDSFTDVICMRASRVDHSGAMEAHALLLLAQWLCRSPSRCGSRVLVAEDAQAVLHAAKKGRSSSPSLRRPIMHLGAYCLAFGLQLLLIWVPSEHNPADKPSRGSRRRRPCSPPL